MNEDILIQLKEVTLFGSVAIPKEATGMVIFVHGSGSSRLSPRNRYVAQALNQAGFATCLFDLLTEQEEVIDEATMALRFNIELLASRLVEVTSWLLKEYQDYHFPLSYFGASTGAAAALRASTHHAIKAIVSRGGRPDLAADSLPKVSAATLLIVGGNDPVVIDLNMSAFNHLFCEKELRIIPDATHLFEESGKLDEVISNTIQWLKLYLVSSNQ
jgi:dienelactone hydrolase